MTIYKPGDTFFTKLDDHSYKWYHRLALQQICNYQKYFLNIPSPANEIVHIGLVTDWPYGLHSTGDAGIARVNISEHYPDAIIKRHVDMTPEKGAKLVEEASKYISKEYDNWANIKFAAPLLFMFIRKLLGMDFNYSKYNCIGYVISAMRAVGLKVGWILDPEDVSPGMEFLDPALLDIDKDGNVIGDVARSYTIPPFVTKALR